MSTPPPVPGQEPQPEQPGQPTPPPAPGQATPPPAPDQAPPPHGQQPGQPPYVQPGPAAQPSPAPQPYPGGAQPAPPAPYTAAPTPTPRPKGPATLGVIGFVLGLLGTVAGAIIAGVGGAQAMALTGEAGLMDTTKTVDPNAVSPEVTAQIAGAFGVVVIGWVVYALLGLAALIIGIIAIVQKRGRGWGIAALIIAVLGWIAVLIALVSGFAAGAAPYA